DRCPPIVPQTTPGLTRRSPMAIRSWIRRLFARTPRTIRNAPARFRPRFEILEDRTVLSAPSPYTVSSFSSSAGQFGVGAQSALSGSYFLGGNFDVGGQVGGITAGFGASADFGLAGKAGLNASYSIDTGTVFATYNDLTLAQNFVEPTQF